MRIRAMPTIMSTIKTGIDTSPNESNTRSYPVMLIVPENIRGVYFRAKAGVLGLIGTATSRGDRLTRWK